MTLQHPASLEGGGSGEEHRDQTHLVTITLSVCIPSPCAIPALGTGMGAATCTLLPWVLGTHWDEGSDLQPIQELCQGSGDLPGAGSSTRGSLLLPVLRCAAETFMQRTGCKRGGKSMFYYPPSSCCFVLWGSFSEEVRLRSRGTKPRSWWAPGSWYPPAQHPLAPIHPIAPGWARGGPGAGQRPQGTAGEVHLLLCDFYQAPPLLALSALASGGRRRGPAPWVLAWSCVLLRPESRLRGQTVREQLRGQGRERGPGLVPIAFPGMRSLPFPEEAECSGRGIATAEPWGRAAGCGWQRCMEPPSLESWLRVLGHQQGMGSPWEE